MILSIKAIFAYVIPDMPSRIVIQLQRERYLTRQAILLRNDLASSQKNLINEQQNLNLQESE